MIPVITTEIQILLLLSFISWVIFGFLIWKWVKNSVITKADIFSALVSCLWLISLMTGLEISFWFDIIGAMATTHLIGEKSAKTFLDFILQYRKWK